MDLFSVLLLVIYCGSLVGTLLTMIFWMIIIYFK